MIEIRPETEHDTPAIYEVNRLAFDGREAEPRLVEMICHSPGFIPGLSLVAALEGQVVGHILFSRVIINTAQGELPTLALAPMAVLPELQNQGIGSQLVRQGLEACRRLGERSVIVLGHPNYYPRFGFRPARPLRIESPYDVPDDVWMALELEPGALSDIQGKVRYPPAFDGV